MTETAIDRNSVFVHAMPAAPLADSRAWRITAQWHEHVHWARFDVADMRERGGFIREFCDKIGIPWEQMLWIDSRIDEAVKEWLAHNEETELLDRRVTLLLTRVNDQEKTIETLCEALERAEKRLERIAAFCEVLKQERKAVK
jgi:uncharacterized coiled-coil protein SlyX